MYALFDDSRWGRWSAAFLVGFLLILFGLVMVSPVNEVGSDPYLTLFSTQVWLTSGSLDLSEFADLLNPWIATQRLVETESGLYYAFPVGTQLLAAPFVWVLNQLGFDFVGGVTSWIEFEVQKVLAALSCVLVFWLLYRLCRELLPFLAALSLAVLLFCGSTLISTLGTAFWSMNAALLWLTLGLWLLVRLELGKVSEQRIVLAGVVLGSVLWGAFISRPTTAVPILAILLVLLWRKPRAGIPAALSAALLLVGFLLWSNSQFGSWLPPYYQPTRLGLPLSDWLVALFGLLFSPNRGLFVYSPVLLLISVWLAMRWRQLNHRPLLVCALLTIGGLLLTISRFDHWWGGASFGPRLLTETLPSFALLGGLLLQPHIPQAGQRPFRSRFLWLFVLLGGVGIAIHSLIGLYNQASTNWNGRAMLPQIDQTPERLFDWQDLQLLATLEDNCGRNLAFHQRLLAWNRVGLRPLTSDLTLLPPQATLPVQDVPEPNWFGEIVWPARFGEVLNAELPPPPREKPPALYPAIFTGWLYPDAHQVRSVCPTAAIYFGAVDQPIRLELEFGPSQPQVAEVWLNGRLLTEVTLSESGSRLDIELLPSQLVDNQPNQLQFSFQPVRGELPNGVALTRFSLTLVPE